MEIRKVTGKSVGAEALYGVGLIAAMFMAKAANKLAGDTIAVNGGMAAAGFAGSLFIDDPKPSDKDLFLTKGLKGLSTGLCLYGFVKSISALGVPNAPVVNGIGFTAPEGVRKFITDYFPTLGNVQPDFANLSGFVGNLQLPELTVAHPQSSDLSVLNGISAAA